MRPRRRSTNRTLGAPRGLTVAGFNSILFGYAEAQEEATEHPSLLRDAFLDLEGIPDRVFRGSEWLVLGYKGSGKSAIAEHILLEKALDPLAFVNLVDLQGFEYNKFAQIVSIAESDETRISLAWSWILFIQIARSFLRDQGAGRDDGKSMSQIRDALEQFGGTSSDSLQQLIRQSVELSGKIGLPNLFEVAGKETLATNSTDFASLIEPLRHIIGSIKSESQHLLIFDGLDTILTNDRLQYVSISMLVIEAATINRFLKRCGVPAKIIVLLRTDIFEVLASANKNKMRQDNSIELDWRGDPRYPRDSLLYKLANLRAQYALRRRVDIFEEFFPDKVFHQPFAKYCLEMTRHTPRDFLQLMNQIQKSFRATKKDAGDAATIRNALRDYSVKYFLPEIFDEMHGYVSHKILQKIFEAIGATRRREFKIADRMPHIGNDPSVTDALPTVLHALFECSAIGNIRKRREGNHYLAFRYRNRHAAFRPDEIIILHKSLWRAFNLPLHKIGDGVEEYFYPQITEADCPY